VLEFRSDSVAVTAVAGPVATSQPNPPVDGIDSRLATAQRWPRPTAVATRLNTLVMSDASALVKTFVGSLEVGSPVTAVGLTVFAIHRRAPHGDYLTARLANVGK
jgi:hypothetical protein